MALSPCWNLCLGLQPSRLPPCPHNSHLHWWIQDSCPSNQALCLLFSWLNVRSFQQFLFPVFLLFSCSPLNMFIYFPPSAALDNPPCPPSLSASKYSSGYWEHSSEASRQLVDGKGRGSWGGAGENWGVLVIYQVPGRMQRDLHILCLILPKMGPLLPFCRSANWDTGKWNCSTEVK